MHHPGSVASWPLSSGGDLFIIPGVWKVGCCYLWAICPLSQEFGKLTSVFCGRFVHYPRCLKSWLLLSEGDLSIISGVWKVGCCYLWAICPLSQEFGKLVVVICGRFVRYSSSLASWPVLPVGDIVVYVIINGVICHAELNLIIYRCSERSAEVKEIVDLTSTPPLGFRGLF